MARGYPRFLYSNPTNTKSEGPFILHTLFPKKLYHVHWLPFHNCAQIFEIKAWGDECNEEESSKLLIEVIKWFDHQLKVDLIKKLDNKK